MSRDGNRYFEDGDKEYLQGDELVIEIKESAVLPVKRDHQVEN